MSTLRQKFADAGVDLGICTIVFQPVGADAYSPGWAGDDTMPAETITAAHPIIDTEFDDGHGSPQMPRILVDDGVSIWFPVMYDGATWLGSVPKDITAIVGKTDPTPYPGGG